LVIFSSFYFIIVGSIAIFNDLSSGRVKMGKDKIEIPARLGYLDIRSILARGYYYSPDIKETYLKKLDACVKAGYSRDYAEHITSKILGLDTITDTLPLVWKKLENDLVLCQEMLHSWLKTHAKSARTVDIRELVKIIRLIGDSVGKFVKKELKMELKKEEKHVYLHFDDPKDEIAYHQEVIDLHKGKMQELEGGVSALE